MACRLFGVKSLANADLVCYGHSETSIRKFLFNVHKLIYVSEIWLKMSTTIFHENAYQINAGKMAAIFLWA